MGVCPTLGACPRHFGLSPCGSYLLAANQDSDAVRVFTRCPDTGVIRPTGEEHAVACPNFVLFVRPQPAAAPACAKPAQRKALLAPTWGALEAAEEAAEPLASPVFVTN